MWSSASRRYVEAIVAEILRGHDLRFVWANERCTRRLDSETREHCWAKNLKKTRKLGFQLEHIVMLDDSPEKLRDNYGNHLQLRSVGGVPDPKRIVGGGAQQSAAIRAPENAS